jgi:hypothetical protein
MFYLIYVSNATRALVDHELEAILEKSRKENEHLQVTGLLLYKDVSFMQLLEGAEATVRTLLERIVCDPRHYHVTTLQCGETESRQFPDWTMGFRRLDESAERVPGYRDFEALLLTGAEFRSEPARSLRLLQLFMERI